MKKIIAGITAALLLTAGTVTVLAGNHCSAKTTSAGSYGVCGYHTENCQYNDTDNDGICDLCGTKSSHCQYTDADNDGICDLCGSNKNDCSNSNGQFCTGVGRQNGTGAAQGYGTGSGNAGNGCQSSGTGNHHGLGHGCRR